MANEQNLVPLNERTKSERREIAKKGGIASGISRRRNKRLKEAADLYLSLPVANKKRWNEMSKKGIDPEDIDNQMAVIVGLAEMAALGDSRCARVLVDILGENPKDESDGGVTIVDDIP